MADAKVDGSTLGRQQIYRRVAQLHMECIDQGFLPKLGLRFLALMYQAIDEGEDSVLLVRMEGDEIIGFISGATGIGQVYRRMLRHPASLLVALAPSLFRPTRLRRIFDIIRYSGRGLATRKLPTSELLSIGVGSFHRRKGHADALYLALCEHFRRRGVPRFKIAVGARLATAHRFYERMGATRAMTLAVHAEEMSVLYVADVPV